MKGQQVVQKQTFHVLNLFNSTLKDKECKSAFSVHRQHYFKENSMARCPSKKQKTDVRPDTRRRKKACELVGAAVIQFSTLQKDSLYKYTVTLLIRL